MPLLLALLLLAPARVVRAPDPRSPRAAVARAGAERAARKALEGRRKGKGAAEEDAEVRVRYGSDGGVEVTLEPKK